ncbi:ABC transporter [bacterium B13(2017)]|nr:ABC transporter [bacterium B13(2017)]
MNKNQIKQSAICFKGVDFAYQDELILKDVDLCISKNDIVGIVGPNAGGKTTLLKLILGLLKPINGEINIFGESSKKNRMKIGYVPQHLLFDPLFPVSVIEVVLMGRVSNLQLGCFSKIDKDAAYKVLKEVNLFDVRNNSFSKLSGGQRQRALIARALVSDPEILLLDEATSNLDQMAMNNFYDLIKVLNERMTIIFVSHDIGVISSIVNTVVCVNRKVVIHPTTEMSGEIISDIYGSEMAYIRHDKHSDERVHKCQDS